MTECLLSGRENNSGTRAASDSNFRRLLGAAGESPGNRRYLMWDGNVFLELTEALDKIFFCADGLTKPGNCRTVRW